MIYLSGSRNFGIVITLLTELIIFYVKLIPIDFGVLALKKRLQGLFQALVDFQNTFMNFIKKFLIKKKLSVRLRVLKEVKTLLLLVSDLLSRL